MKCVRMKPSLSATDRMCVTIHDFLNLGGFMVTFYTTEKGV